MAENNSENETLSNSENETLSNSEKKTLSKLDIDRPQDFKFHIAYEVYSQAWDDNDSESIRARLNDLISSLSNDGSYGGFYAQMKPYRRDLDSFSPGRKRIQGQKKRAWAKDDAKARRNRRYK
ncbi:hypothetical protein [[Eubacterium] cellulosolvens]|jgi:hypothetical protein